MNKNDIILILSIIILLGFFFLFKDNSSSNEAIVYYEDNEVLRINLNKELTEYTVNGYLGQVIIEAGNNKIRVKEENSPKHLCSIQGFVSNSYTPIICLPNKIIIKIQNKQEIDGVV